MSALALLVCLLLATNAGDARAAAKRDCSRQFGSFAVGNWPPPCWRPYGPKSPFNSAIPAAPRLAPESKAIVEYMLARDWSFPDDHRGNFAIGAYGSRPVYWAQRSDPVVRVICKGGGTCRRGMRLHMPNGAQPQNESDGHMTVVDQAARREYDFWRASPPEHGEIATSAASSIPIGAGIGMGIGGYGEASYLGLLGGLIRARELKAGNVNHALAMTVQCVQPNDVWPAPAWGRGDSVCADRGAGPHLGSLVQLTMSDREIAATHAPAWQRAIMKAMAHYGIYVVDTNGPSNTELSLIQEDDLSFTSFGHGAEMSGFVNSLSGTDTVRGVPIDVSRLRVIAPCVPRRTC